MRCCQARLSVSWESETEMGRGEENGGILGDDIEGTWNPVTNENILVPVPNVSTEMVEAASVQ